MIRDRTVENKSIFLSMLKMSLILHLDDNFLTFFSDFGACQVKARERPKRDDTPFE